jgi:hypothetical protein
MSLLLESSLRREGNECAFLIQISRPKLFNSAELICSHGGECLKVRADLMHLVRCSALLALMGDPFVLVSHGSFCANFLVMHCSFQAIPANFDTHLCRLSAPASCLLYSFHSCRQNWVVYIREDLFKLPTGHLNLVSKSALYAKH